MTNGEPRQLVQEFHTTFNARDLERLTTLLHDDVRYNGRGGDGAGKHLIDEWIGRATTTLTPERWFEEEGVVVVEDLIEWRSKQDDRVIDSRRWGIAFEIEDDRITGISRFANVGEAITKMGMIDPDEVEWHR